MKGKRRDQRHVCTNIEPRENISKVPTYPSTYPSTYPCIDLRKGIHFVLVLQRGLIFKITGKILG